MPAINSWESAPEIRWLITDKGDIEARDVVDGYKFGANPHYSRKTPKARQFCRNGSNLVLITDDGLACWVTYSTLQRQDGLDAWECSLFVNRGPHLSSSLIREATALTFAVWGLPPVDGLISMVQPNKVLTNKEVAGYCFRRAGWKLVGKRRAGKLLVFKCPWPNWLYDYRYWAFKEGRANKLKTDLERVNNVV